MERVLGHRQTKEAATDHSHLPPPRHIPTLPDSGSWANGLWIVGFHTPPSRLSHDARSDPANPLLSVSD